MGSIYQRTERHCATCRTRLARSADRLACIEQGHAVEERQSPVYWIRYTRAGKSYNESSGSKRKADARTLLQEREGDIVRGKPVTPKIGKTTFDEAAADSSPTTGPTASGRSPWSSAGSPSISRPSSAAGGWPTSPRPTCAPTSASVRRRTRY